MPPIVTEKVQKSRKERRKEERLAKKDHLRKKSNNRSTKVNNEEEQLQNQQQRATLKVPPISNTSKVTSVKTDNIGHKRKIDKISVSKITNNIRREDKPTKKSMASSTTATAKVLSNSKNRNDPYNDLDPNIAAALRRDDEEIAMLEAKLGKASKDKERLKREYAKLEGYGNDFGDFLDDLDLLVQNVVTGTSTAAPTNTKLSSTTKKSNLNMYKTLSLHDENSDDDDSDNGYDNASDFSDEDDIDNDMDVTDSSDEMDDNFNSDGTESEIENNIIDDDHSDIDDDGEDAYDEDDHDDFDDNEEIIPMKKPARLDDASDNSSDNEDENVSNDNAEIDDNDSNSGSDDDVVNNEELEKDHDASDIYRPSKGEDIYGNVIDSSNDGNVQPKKYIPPHLRKAQEEGGIDQIKDDGRTQSIDNNSDQSMRVLQRLLNNALNRLSEGTIVSVVQSISQIYVSHPTADVNEALWVHTQNACISNQAVVMIGLIPIYVSALVGVYIQKGDSIQLMEYLLEQVVTKFWSALQNARKQIETSAHKSTIDDEEENFVPVASKEICNLALLICYMYNFGVVHCTLMYDIIRHLIENCSELDVEILLLLINHCGRTLRSDDANALKEIITLVQNQSVDDTQKYKNTSRNQFMIDALLEIKKHKRRKQDQSYSDQTSKLRKILGHIKTTANAASKGRGSSSSDSSLRISLRDILDVHIKGRWWKVGASWAGSDPNLLSGKVVPSKYINSERTTVDQAGSNTGNEFETDKLLQLAAKYRMNTDSRRTIFCILMGAADYEDCFEKLVRAGMLKNRSERDVVRVIMECCGNESTYNPFYAHLSARICDYQPQCRFTFQLAYWDTFKLLHEYKPRKIASLAKLLYQLVVVHTCLKLNVIKTIDIGEPEVLSEEALLFVTIFLSSILEHFDKPEDAFRLFQKCIRRKSDKSSKKRVNDDDLYDDSVDDDGMGASFTIFMVQILKASPKYQKGSKFHSNLKAAIKACDMNNFF